MNRYFFSPVGSRRRCSALPGARNCLLGDRIQGVALGVVRTPDRGHLQHTMRPNDHLARPKHTQVARAYDAFARHRMGETCAASRPFQSLVADGLTA